MTRPLRPLSTVLAGSSATLLFACVFAAGCKDAGEPEPREASTAAVSLTTFGTTSPGSVLEGMSADFSRVSKFRLKSKDVVVSKLSVYLAGDPDADADATASQAVRGVVYAADGDAGAPGTLLCQTQDYGVPPGKTAGWVELPIASTCSLGRSGDYYLGLQSGPGATVARYGAAPASGRLRTAADIFSDGPRASFPAGPAADLRLSIFATYAPAGAAAPSPPAGAEPGPAPTPPASPPPVASPPPFLAGLTKLFSNDCSSPTPVEAGKVNLYSMQRNDGVEVSSTSFADIAPDRFEQHASGGPENAAYYHFHAPQGDNIWTPNTAGRSEIGYPIGSPGGNVPSHLGPPDTFFFYEGRRHVIMFSVRLSPGWDLDAPSWRVVTQLKQNEWVETGGLSPALALEQRAGEWLITSFGGPTIWSMPATGAVGRWIRFAFDITFSGDADKGKVKVYADTDLDGVYEYQSSVWTGKTLVQQGGTGVESVWLDGLYEGVGGDALDKAEYAIWGP